MMISVRWKILSICLALVLPLVSASHAFALDYNETTHGDLSDDPGAPTSLGTLPVGVHTLSASFVENDFDLLTFTLAPGTRITSIYLDSYSGSTLSFSGLQAGPVWTADLGYSVDPSLLLGWALFGESSVGTELLDDYAMAANAIGFTQPLQAGTYTLELQETSSDLSTAQFSVTVVPEPSALVIVATACVAAFFVSRRRAKMG